MRRTVPTARRKRLWEPRLEGDGLSLALPGLAAGVFALVLALGATGLLAGELPARRAADIQRERDERAHRRVAPVGSASAAGAAAPPSFGGAQDRLRGAFGAGGPVAPVKTTTGGRP